MARTLDIEPIDATFGAVVRGIKVAEVDDETFRALYDAWLEYALLIFPDQHLKRDQQIAFAKRFGPLEFEMTAISNVRSDGTLRLEKDNDDVMKILKGNMGWHHDSTYMPVQAKGAVFSAEEVPTIGGRTGFADMRAAYDALDDETKEEVQDMVCEHSQMFSRQIIGFYDFTDEERERFKPVRQCMVRTHPVTGRKSLYLSSHAGGIVGWPMPEARGYLRDLIEHATQREFVYTHKWRVGDLVMWDNRQTMHRARPFPAHEPRDMRRTTLAGDGPTAMQIAA